MTASANPGSTRHLVDPDLDPALDGPQFELSAGNLPVVRATMAEAAAGTPDLAPQYPGITRSDHHAPSLDGDPDVPVRLYVPEGKTTAGPGLVWIHGGGYVMGSAAADDYFCYRVAAETGAAVVSVDYRLAPETPAPGAVHDCYAALAWLHGQAAELGIDPAKIAIGGASAGGGHAATLTLLARDRGEFAVSYQLLIYPMLDDRTGSGNAPNPYAGEFVWTAAANRFGWTALLGQEPGADKVPPYAVPAREDDLAALPAAYLSVGALDLFVDENLEYARRLMRAGVPVELHVYPGAFHGYYSRVPDARVSQANFRDLLGALNRHFHG